MPLKKSSLSVSTNLMYIHLSFQIYGHYGGACNWSTPKIMYFISSLILLRFIPSDLPVVFLILREKQSQRVSLKGPERKVNKYGKLGLTAWGDFKEIFCDIYFELPLFNTTKLYERYESSINVKIIELK